MQSRAWVILGYQPAAEVAALPTIRRPIHEAHYLFSGRVRLWQGIHWKFGAAVVHIRLFPDASSIVVRLTLGSEVRY